MASTRVMWAVRSGALLWGVMACWEARHANNPGGISYLDIADAYMRGDFANAINGYWSPLYSLVLGPALVLLRPSAYYEASVAHLVNFLIYCAAMVAFDRFLREVMSCSKNESGDSIPASTWIVFGYAAFTWSSLVLIDVSNLSADLLMATFVYGAAAILVRMQQAPLSLAAGVLLGAALGLGYLSKAAMFPLSFVFIATAFASRGEWRRNLPVVGGAVLAFSIVTAPFIVALSLQKGRPTFGDVGKLVYAWFVNDVAKYAHWQGESPGRGTPVHPDRRIHEHPTVFEYATPVSGTHPIWYDPTYWYEGMETFVSPTNELRALVAAARVYWHLALDATAPLVAIVLLLLLGPREDLARRIGQQWFLLIPGLVPFAMFAVLHTETRFLGGFVVMLLMALLMAVRLPSGAQSRQIATISLLAASTVLAARAVPEKAGFFANRRNIDYDIASGLQAMGLRPGDRVGKLGWAYDDYWARLAHVRIIAETPEPEVIDFWADTPEGRRSVFDVYRSVGVRVIVAEWVPNTAAAEGWRPVGGGDRYAYWLDMPPH